MTLKEKIQSDFIVAMKSKDDVGKRALSGLKSKITESEKSNKNIELDDNGVIKVIISVIFSFLQKIVLWFLINLNTKIGKKMNRQI